MYRKHLSQKASPSVRSTPINQEIAKSPSYGSLSGVVQRVQQDPNSVSEDERQQLESAIGSRSTKEILAGKQTPWVPEFQGISAQIWGNSGQVAPIQAKLTIGEVGDKYEQEADRVAQDVVQQIHAPQTNPPTTLQRQQLPEIVQRREAITGGEASTDLDTAINTARGSGQPLDVGLQQSMGQAMGADFSGVRVHTDAQADKLNRSIQAKAFTTGVDVFFRQGEYQPGSQGGQELIAHELTHVVQQNRAAVQRSPLPQPQLQPYLATECLVIQRVYAPATITAGKNVRLHRYKMGTQAHFWSPRIGDQTTEVESSGIETLQNNDLIEADTADTFTKSQVFGADKNFTKARSQTGNVGYIKDDYFTISDRVGETNFYAVTTGLGVFRFYDYTTNTFLGPNHPNLLQTEAITILNHLLTAEETNNIEIAKKDELMEKIIHTASLGQSPIDPDMWGTAVGNIQSKIIPRLNAERANLIDAGLITANHTLKKVEFTGADFHKHGQIPIFCIFDTDGVINPPDPRKIVYKPGNLAVDRALYNRANSLANALNPEGDQIPTYTLIDAEDADHEHFTLMEFVKSDVPRNTADLTGVWASIGANAAMAYIVGLEDIHNENVLLLQNRIQIIDMEATTGRFTTFSAMLWNKAINEGIGPKLQSAAREGMLTSGTTNEECQTAAQRAFRDTLSRYQNVEFNAEYTRARDTLAGSRTRLVPIATADLYKGIIAARKRGTLENWRNWLNNDGNYYVDECKGQTGSTKDFIKNVLLSPGTYNALVRGDVPYYSRDLGTSHIFDEEGNQIDERGCSKVGRAINVEMNERRDTFGEPEIVVVAFNIEIIPLLTTLNKNINTILQR